MTPVLESGLVGSCLVCRRSTVWWHRGADRYHPVHPSSPCLDRLEDAVTELEAVSSGAQRLTGTRRNAWGRRGLAASTSTAPARHGLSRGSSFHRPGMIDGAPWVALAETNFGHLLTRSDGDAHVRAVHERWRLLTDMGREVTTGGVFAVGAVVLDPAGAVVARWGDPVSLGAPRWRPMQRASHWTRCVACSRVLWPGCLVLVGEGRCSTCTADTESDDPRRWPDEPFDPGMNARPKYLGGPKRPKSSGRSSEGS